MPRAGFTLLELLVAIAVLGILAGVGAMFIRPDPFEVRQAAQASANALTRARLEAIRVNGWSTVVYDGGSLIVCTATTPITACGTGTRAVSANLHLGADFPRVVVTPSADFSLTFDRRGVARTANGSIRFATRDGGTARRVLVTPAGQVVVEEGA